MLTILLTRIPDVQSGIHELSLPHHKHIPSLFIHHDDRQHSENHYNTLPLAGKNNRHHPTLYSPPGESFTPYAFHNLSVASGLFAEGAHDDNRNDYAIPPINGPPPDGDRGTSGDQPFKSKATASHADSCFPTPAVLLAGTGKNPMLPDPFPGEAAFIASAEGGIPLAGIAIGRAPALSCPDDISTYTDINQCDAFIAGDLDPWFDEDEVVNLTWVMEGGTEDASPAQGIHLIGDYTFPEGTTIITYRATGTDGSTTECMFTVTISDNQVPRLESMPGNIVVAATPGQCSNTVFWIPPQASDNCTPRNQIRVEGSARPGDVFPVGVTRVYYRAYDAMGNESQPQSFTVTVQDNQLPELLLPADVSVACGQPLPAAWTSLQQLTVAGGTATDNCSIDEASFRLLTEIKSSEVCPYTLTRTYEVKDVNGNAGTAAHRVHVTGENPAAAQEETVPPAGLKSAMGDIMSTETGGPWHEPGTWVGEVVPGTGDNVTIVTGAIVTAGNVVIDGLLTLQGGATLSVGGNWTNNGIFTAATNSLVEFTGNSDAVIGGTQKTVFKDFKLNKAASSILEVNGSIDLDENITFTSGKMQINSGGIVTCTHNAGFTIEADAGLGINGGTFTSGGFSIENKGLFELNSGTANLGMNSGNSLTIRSEGTFNVNGGELNIAGRLEVSGGTADIENGTINLNTVGHPSSTVATLDLSATAKFTMNGGTVVFTRPCNTYLDLEIANSGTGYKHFNGGEFIFGTSALGTEKTFRLSSVASLPDISTQGNAHLSNAGTLTLGNNLNLNGDSKLYLNGNPIRLYINTIPGTYTFPITDSNGEPIEVTIELNDGTVTDGAYIEVSTSESATVPTGLNTTSYLNRSWNISSYNLDNFIADITFNFNYSELLGGAAPGELKMHQTDGTPNFYSVTSGTNSLTIEGVRAFGEFGAAECGIILLTANKTDITCFNAKDGIVNLTITGGVAPYSCNWTGPDNFTSADQNLSFLSPGIYEVTVTDAAGCTETTSIEIEEPLELSATIGASTDVPCYAEATGTATVTVTGGTSPYTYLWNNGQTDATATGLIAGDYTATVIDANGCTATVSVTITQPEAELTVLLIEKKDVVCYNSSTGSVKVGASGGTSPYSFKINGGDSRADGEFSGLAPGSHIITVTDANDCYKYLTVQVNNPQAELTATAANTKVVTCKGGSNGEATVTPQGGWGEYTYLWDDPDAQTTATASGLAAGDYSVTVTDGNGCKTVATVTVYEPEFSLDISAFDIQVVTCHGDNDGSVTITAEGGWGGYTYLWNSNPEWNTPKIENLIAGTYTVLIRDAEGCEISRSFDVDEPPTELSISVEQTKKITCYDDENGEITVIATGGWGVYQYSLDGKTYTSNNLFEGLKAGTYNIYLKDVEDCLVSQELVSAPPAPLTLSAEINHVSCNGGSDGKITLVAEGGWGGYTYSIDGNTFFEDYEFDGLTADEYTFFVKDSEGCVKEGTFSITEPPALGFVFMDFDDVSCAGGNDGTITVSAAGGTGTLTYSINIPSEISNTTGLFTGLEANSYTITLKDDNDCTKSIEIEVGTVEDVTDPVLTGCPGNIIRYSEVVNPFSCNQVVNWTPPTATDDCELVSFTSNYIPGYAFPVGTTTVVYTATDASGNIATCSFDVTVHDNTLPTISCRSDISVNTGAGICGAVVNYTTPVGTDNCAGATTVQIAGLASGSIFPVGVTTNIFEVTDAAGNKASCSFTVTVRDNRKPVLTLPDDIPVKCNDSFLPENTGWATASDNCNTPTIAYSDSLGNPSMSCVNTYTIFRKWIAEDSYGNKTTETQKIFVSDAKGPEVIFANKRIIVDCPDDIPVFHENLAEFLATHPLNSAYDLCYGSVTMKLHDEYSFFDSNSGIAGYCPDSVKRIYRFYDECLNYTDVEQTIIVSNLSSCTCSECTEQVVVWDVDLRANPDSVWSLKKESRDKGARCCLDDVWWEEGGNDPYRCVSFNVILDDGAIGVQITTSKGQDSKEWRVDCEQVNLEGPNGDIICLPAGEYHLFSHCKQGGDGIDYTIRSVRGIVESHDIETRVNCLNEIYTTGDYTGEPVWSALNSIYDKYLDTTNPHNPVFYIPIEDKDNVPATIQYQVCAHFDQYICGQSVDGRVCDTITVHVYDPIETNIDLGDLVVCQGNPAYVEPVISPAGDYVIEWFEGTGTTGPKLHTGDNYTIATTGWYSIKVTEYESGLPCNETQLDFEVEVDLTRPGLSAPPDTLFLDCDDPFADQKIIYWLESAWAYQVNVYGDTIFIEVENNYTGINLVCDEVVNVEFKAVDNCNLDSINVATIVVIDNNPPTIIQHPSPGFSACINTDADEDEGFVNWLANHGGARANDICDDALEWTYEFITDWVPDPETKTKTITVQFTATDDCDNFVTTNEVTYTLSDDGPPVFTKCPTGQFVLQAITGLCEITEYNADLDAVGFDECSEPVLSYILELPNGETVNGEGTVNGYHFPVGETKVTYVLTDDVGNKNVDPCEFFVIVEWEKIEDDVISCPANPEPVDATESCVAWVAVDAPVVDNPCESPVIITHDSQYSEETENANGFYPVGITEVIWTIILGGVTEQCTVYVEVKDAREVILECPDDIYVFADEGALIASDVELFAPVHSDNCEYTLSWEMKDPEGIITGSDNETPGIYVITGKYTFKLGTTTITYTLIDIDGVAHTCSFNVIVEAAPEIKCQADATINLDENCISAFNPGVPDLIKGGQPIDWTWIITWVDENDEVQVLKTGTSTTTKDNPTPDPIVPEAPHEFNFPVGVSTITWTATNEAGHDECTQTITVVDNIPPTFTAADKEFCVENLFLAQYTGDADNLKYDPDYPNADYYLFRAGTENSTVLDLDLTTYSDNCCDLEDGYSIRWTINFDDNTSVSGNGQPSEHETDIRIWGDGETYGNRYHTITYWMKDCHGNEDPEGFTATITITPRPKIEKVTR